MRKAILVILGMVLIMWQFTASAPQAKADWFGYPCQPGTGSQGIGVDVNFIVDASGQFCDGPTEINLTHAHCEAGGANVSGGALAFTNGGPLSIGGIGGSGIGGGGQGCSYRCPDNTVAPAPNPPGVGQTHYIDVRAIIKANKAFCVREGHLTPAGPTSVLVSPDEGFPPSKDLEPYQIGDPNVQIEPPVAKTNPTSEPSPVASGEPGPIQIPNPIENIPSTPPVQIPGGVTVPSLP